MCITHIIQIIEASVSLGTSETMDLENLTELEVEIIMLVLDEPLSDRFVDAMRGLYFPQVPPTIEELVEARESAWEKVRDQYDAQV